LFGETDEIRNQAGERILEGENAIWEEVNRRQAEMQAETLASRGQIATSGVESGGCPTLPPGAKR